MARKKKGTSKFRDGQMGGGGRSGSGMGQFGHVAGKKRGKKGRKAAGRY